MKNSAKIIGWVAAAGVAGLAGFVALIMFSALLRGSSKIYCEPPAARPSRREAPSPAPVALPVAAPELQMPERDEAPFARSRRDARPEELSVEQLRELSVGGNRETEKDALRRLLQEGSDHAEALALGRILSLETTDPRFADYLEVLAHANSGRMGPWLIEELGRTTHPDMRKRLLAVIARLAEPTMTTDLILALEAGAGRDLLHAADLAEALVQQTSPGQVSVLKDAFLHTESAEIRRLVAAALANIGNREAASFLVAQAAMDTPQAADGLEVIPVIRSVHAQETLIVTAMNRAYPAEVRAAAVTALAHQPGTRVVTVLENLARAEPSPVVRGAVEHSLEALAAVPVVVQQQAVAVSGPQEESWYREPTGL